MDQDRLGFEFMADYATFAFAATGMMRGFMEMRRGYSWLCGALPTNPLR
jgi:hypothetical protein